MNAKKKGETKLKYMSHHMKHRPAFLPEYSNKLF